MVTGLIMTGLTLVTGFVSTPWILRNLGQERFGAFRALTDWFGYLTILDLGVSGSVLARLGPKIGAGDETGVAAVLTAGFRVYLWIAVTMFAGGAVLVLGLPHFMNLRAVTPHELRIAAWILLVQVVLVPFSVFRGLAEARQRGYMVNLLIALQAVCTVGLLAWTAWMRWGLIGQAVATIVGMTPVTAVLVYLGLRRHPGVLSTRPDPEATQALRKLNWPTFWFNVSGRFGLLSDNTVIAWILGPIAVAPFFLTQRLAQIAQLQLQSIGNASWAGLVELYVQGQTGRFCSRLSELTALVSALAIIALGPIAAYNHHFIALWLGPDTFAGESVNNIACVNIWMWSISSLWTWPISGAGHITEWVPYALWFTAVNVVVSIGATSLIGISGPLVGTFTAFILVHSWALPRVLGKLFHPSLSALWKPALAPLAWGAPYGALLWFIAHKHTPRGWFGLAAEASAAVFCGLLFWWLSLDARLKQEWQFRFRSALAL